MVSFCCEHKIASDGEIKVLGIGQLKGQEILTCNEGITSLTCMLEVFTIWNLS